MSETLKTRVGRVIAGSLNALIDRIEDLAPEAVMEQSISESDAVVGEVRHELGIISANRHLSQQQHATLNREHAKLAEQVSEALVGDRDDLVRAAVGRQLDIEAQLPVLEAALGELTRQESELRSYVAALLAKKREMQDALAAFRKSREAATTAATGNAAASQTQQRIDGVIDAFDRVYARQTGLAGTGHGRDLAENAKLKELEDMARDNKIAERMAQLKANKA